MNQLSEVIEKVTRPAITVLLVATFCVGFLFAKGIDAGAVKDVVLVVVSFWFGQRGAQQAAQTAQAARTPEAPKP